MLNPEPPKLCKSYRLKEQSLATHGDALFIKIFNMLFWSRGTNIVPDMCNCRGNQSVDERTVISICDKCVMSSVHACSSRLSNLVRSGTRDHAVMILVADECHDSIDGCAICCSSSFVMSIDERLTVAMAI